MAPERIVLTGVSRGLGRALVPRLVERGHTVLGCARDHDALAELARQFPGPSRFDAVDVSDAAAVEAWARVCLAAGPAPDRVLNNAALMNDLAPLWEVPPEELARLLAVNVAGTQHVIRAFVPAMLARGSGVIVNFSSGWGRSTSPGVAPYCATKWAVEGLTRALAAELPPGLSAVAVNPGIIDTDMLRQCWAEDAGGFPDAEAWAAGAVGKLLALGGADSGLSVSL